MQVQISALISRTSLLHCAQYTHIVWVYIYNLYAA